MFTVQVDESGAVKGLLKDAVEIAFQTDPKPPAVEEGADPVEYHWVVYNKKTGEAKLRVMSTDGSSEIVPKKQIEVKVVTEPVTPKDVVANAGADLPKKGKEETTCKSPTAAPPPEAEDEEAEPAIKVVIRKAGESKAGMDRMSDPGLLGKLARFSGGKLADHFNKHVVSQKEFLDDAGELVKQRAYQLVADSMGKDTSNGFDEIQIGNTLIRMDALEPLPDDLGDVQTQVKEGEEYLREDATRPRRVMVVNKSDRQVRTLYVWDPEFSADPRAFAINETMDNLKLTGADRAAVEKAAAEKGIDLKADREERKAKRSV